MTLVYPNSLSTRRGGGGALTIADLSFTRIPTTTSPRPRCETAITRARGGEGGGEGGRRIL